MTDISGGAWISDSTANRYKQTYLKGFLDLSYGDVTLHHGNVVLKGENRSGGSGGDLIVENGSIGIGTNTPQYTLDVTGQIAGHGESIFYRNTTASAKVARIHSVLTLENDANTATYGHGKPCLFMGWTGSDAWAFGQGGTTGVNGNTTTLGLGPGNNTTTDAYGWTPKFNFGTNGHMGIGTSAPQYMLDVRGTIGGENFLDSGTDAYIFDNSQGVMYGKQGAPNVDNDGLQLGTTGTPYERVGMSILNTVGTNSKDDYHTNHGCIQFHTHEAGDKFRTPMTIQYNGNVGIGTNAPTAKLHIHGGALGGNYADEITLANFEHTTSTNVSALKIITRRDVNGSDWYTASTVIRQVTDVAWQAYIIFNPPGNDYGMALGTNNGEALTISSNRNIGIGTNAPIATLHVRGDTNNMGYVSGTSGGAYSWNGSVTIPIQSSTKIIAYFEPATATNSANAYVAVDGELLAVAGVLTASDERIKKDIVDVQDASALETLRQLKPKKYKYKDVINKGEEPVWGFIAQEVRETLPYSTRLMTKTIPNIYELGSVSGDNHDIVTLTTYKTSDFSKDASANLHKTIEFFTIKDQKETAEIIEVIDEYTFKVDKDLSDWSGSVDSSGNIITETQEEIQYDTSGNEVVDASGNVVKTTKTTYPGNELFVYGQEVDDFHAIKKEAIWTIATAALQEVDRQLQTAKGTIQDQETKIQDQETKINAILLRLEKAGIAE